MSICNIGAPTPDNALSDMCAQRRLRLDFRAVWSESLLCRVWKAKDRKFIHADNEYSDLSLRWAHVLEVFCCCFFFFFFFFFCYFILLVRQIKAPLTTTRSSE